ncbi:MAG: TolC family protein [Saprospiraceae bacterium]|nr:TolC family protein [Saprospiraceae bacterium]
MFYSKLRAIILLVLILCYSPSIFAQENYNLALALKDANQNTPSSLLQDILISENVLQQKNFNSKYLPQISISGQATYQSETSGLDINLPGININRLSKDQYKAQLEANQLLFDGGAINLQKKIKSTSSGIETLNAELDMEQVREQIIHIYFSILEIDARIGLLKYKRQDITSMLDKMDAAVKNGTHLKSDWKNMVVEKLNLDQYDIELLAIKENQIKILNILTGNKLNVNTNFELPAEIQSGKTNFSAKPMMRLIDLQKINLNNTKELDLALSRPKASLFLQLGYGKPGLNFLKNEFEPYYLGGFRVQWSLSNLYTKSKDNQINKLGNLKVEIKQKNYQQLLDTKIAGYETEVDKLTRLIKKDREIIQLREEIKNIFSTQLENGSITSTDYLIKLNDENESKINSEVHNIQFIKAQYLLQLHSGQYLSH